MKKMLSRKLLSAVILCGFIVLALPAADIVPFSDVTPGAGGGHDQGQGRGPAVRHPGRAHGQGVRREPHQGGEEHRRQGARLPGQRRQAGQERHLPALLPRRRAQRQRHEPDEGVGVQGSLQPGGRAPALAEGKAPPGGQAAHGRPADQVRSARPGQNSFKNSPPFFSLKGGMHYQAIWQALAPFPSTFSRSAEASANRWPSTRRPQGVPGKVAAPA